MSAELIFEGRNPAAAIEKACTELNVQPDELNYDVLSYGSTGIFGLVGRRKAKIRIIEENSATINGTTTVPKAQNLVSDEDDSGCSKRSSKQSTEGVDELQPAEKGLAIEPLERGYRILERMVQNISSGAKIKIENKNGKTFFDVKGGNAAVLIGKKGQTLEAINFIVDKVVNKNNSKRILVQVDIQGYLKNRKSKIEKIAERLSQKAMQTGKVITIEHFSTQERRIVHKALKKRSEVRTQSKGSGEIRDLLIIPLRTESIAAKKIGRFKKKPAPKET